MRQFVRNPSDIPIDLEIQSFEPKVFTGCEMTSISAGGLSCEIDTKAMIACKVRVSIASVSPPFSCAGEVTWCKPNDKAFEIGVRFIGSDEIITSRMVQQVCQIEHYKDIVFDREGTLLDGKQAAEQWMAKHER